MTGNLNRRVSASVRSKVLISNHNSGSFRVLAHMVCRGVVNWVYCVFMLSIRCIICSFTNNFGYKVYNVPFNFGYFGYIGILVMHRMTW